MEAENSNKFKGHDITWDDIKRVQGAFNIITPQNAEEYLTKNKMWYKDGFFWRKASDDKSDGKGDLIFNTCYKILREGDKSDWAYHAMTDCATLLMLRKRWHDRMSDDTDCKYRIQRFINRTTRDILKVFGIVIHPKFRYQGRMSRDPFIALYAVCVFLERKQFIEVVKMPWYIYSSTTWKWRRRLIKDSRKDYVRRLGWIRANAVVLSNPEFE